MSPALRVLVVDDHAVVRKGAMGLIADQRRDCVFLEASGLAEALALAEAQRPDLVLLDISLPDGNGFTALERLLEMRPDLPVIILSMRHEPEYARRALALGARGYVSKNSAPEDLTQALELVLAGENYVSPGLRPRSNPRNEGRAALSRREREVMRRLGAGERPGDIAASLGLSVKTVSTYRLRVMRKLGLKNAAEFFRYALEKGEVGP